MQVVSALKERSARTLLEKKDAVSAEEKKKQLEFRKQRKQRLKQQQVRRCPARPCSDVSRSAAFRPYTRTRERVRCWRHLRAHRVQRGRCRPCTRLARLLHAMPLRSAPPGCDAM